MAKKDLVFEPLTIANWSSFESLMGEKGGCGGCWCMAFRLSSKEFEANKHEGNKRLKKDLVEAGKQCGLIAFDSGEPLAWIAMAPREDYIKIENSRSLKRIDKKPVWSITCFFVKKAHRKIGLSKLLIKGAAEWASKKGIKTLEAYPAIPYSEKMPDAFLWVGVLSSFTACGFSVVKQNGKSKAMVRLDT